MIETIQVLQHVPFEGPAAIGRWAQARNVALASNRVFEGGPLPDPAATQALLVLGGPMGVHDEQSHPEWDAETARRLTEQCADELESDSPYVQTPEQILRPDAPFEAAQGLAFRLLDRVFTA